MLSMNSYPKDYVDQARSRIEQQVSAYRRLASRAREASGAGSPLAAELDSFEHVFFNGMVLLLDNYFVHRSRTLEKKDGNPLNEARLLCNAIINHGDVMTPEKSIKFSAENSVLGYRFGETIRLTDKDFARLSAAFFTELESKFV
jgi:hypothetical protein